MFLKEFRFQSRPQYVDEKDKASYCVSMHRIFRQQLWKVRTYTVIDNIVPEFEPVEIGGSSQKGKEEIDNIVRFARSQEKLILYGVGKDCAGLLERLTIVEQEKFLFCDRKAAQSECMFRGKRVLAPHELCKTYQEYKILITSSMYSHWILQELKDMGISPDRVTCNTVQLWEDA